MFHEFWNIHSKLNNFHTCMIKQKIYDLYIGFKNTSIIVHKIVQLFKVMFINERRIQQKRINEIYMTSGILIMRLVCMCNCQTICTNFIPIREKSYHLNNWSLPFLRKI